MNSPLPTISDYNKAVKSYGGTILTKLNGVEFVPSRVKPFKVYVYNSGSYALVFKAKYAGSYYAIRCFTSLESAALDRIEVISEFFQGSKPAYFVDMQLLKEEIKIDGRLYPIVKMPWVDGLQINDFVTKYLRDQDKLGLLQREMISAQNYLEDNKIAHGDIQSGNVIVQEDSQGGIGVKFIDYDGIFLPLFRGEKSLELGKNEFQHPRRTYTDYNENIDRFSIWVMITAIEAVKLDNSLWSEVMQGGFNTLDNFLFTHSDFISPNSSNLFERLSASRSRSLNYYVSKLKTFCEGSLSRVERPHEFGVLAKEPGINPKVNTKIPQIKESEEATEFKEHGQLEITSEPNCSIFDSKFKKIGTTPIIVDKKEYLSTQIIAIHDDVPLKYKVNNIDVKKHFVFGDFKGGANRVIDEGDKGLIGGDATNQYPGDLVIEDFNIQVFSIEKGVQELKIDWKVKGASLINFFVDGIHLYSEKNQDSGSVSFRSPTKLTGNHRYSIVAKKQNGEAAKSFKFHNFREEKKSFGIYLIIPIILLLVGLGIFNDPSILKGINGFFHETEEYFQTPKVAINQWDIKNILKDHYTTSENNEAQAHLENYRFPVVNYFGAKNLSRQQLSELISSYKKKVSYGENTANLDSLKVENIRNTGNIRATYPMVYSYQVKKDGKEFVNKYLTTVELDSDGKIYYIDSELLQSRQVKRSVEYLKTYSNRQHTPERLFNDRRLSTRLIQLMGRSKFRTFRDSWKVTTTIPKFNNGVFTVEGCNDSDCSLVNMIIIYDSRISALYVGLREESQIETFTEKGNSSDVLQAWYRTMSYNIHSKKNPEESITEGVLNESVYLRAKASWDATLTMLVPKASRVQILSKANREFWYVKFQNQTGFISEVFIYEQTNSNTEVTREPVKRNEKENPEESITEGVLNESVYLRAKASWDGTKIMVVPKASRVQILSKADREFWYVKFQNQTGFISEVFIYEQTNSNTEVAREPVKRNEKKETNTTLEGGTWTYLNSNGKLRTKPSGDGAFIRQIPKGAKVLLISKEGSYYKVSYLGKVGYLHNGYLVDGTWAYLNLNGKLRTEPSGMGVVIKEIPRGEKVLLISKEGGYYKARYQGKVGYLHNGYLD